MLVQSTKSIISNKNENNKTNNQNLLLPKKSENYHFDAATTKSVLTEKCTLLNP